MDPVRFNSAMCPSVCRHEYVVVHLTCAIYRSKSTTEDPSGLPFSMKPHLGTARSEGSGHAKQYTLLPGKEFLHVHRAAGSSFVDIN